MDKMTIDSDEIIDQAPVGVQFGSSSYIEWGYVQVRLGLDVGDLADGDLMDGFLVGLKVERGGDSNACSDDRGKVHADVIVVRHWHLSSVVLLLPVITRDICQLHPGSLF